MVCFEVTGNEGRSIAPNLEFRDRARSTLPPGKRVLEKFNLNAAVRRARFRDLRVRAHIYFADLTKFYYSQTKVFEVTDARTDLAETVGVPEGESASGNVRTYSLMRNRFLDHLRFMCGSKTRTTGSLRDLFARPGDRIWRPQVNWTVPINSTFLYCARARSCCTRASA